MSNFLLRDDEHKTNISEAYFLSVEDRKPVTTTDGWCGSQEFACGDLHDLSTREFLHQ